MSWENLTYDQKLNINLPRYCRNIANDNRGKCIEHLQLDPVQMLPENWKALDYKARLELREQLWQLANDAEQIRRDKFRAANPDLKKPVLTIETVYHVAGTSE